MKKVFDTVDKLLTILNIIVTIMFIVLGLLGGFIYLWKMILS